LFRFLEPTTGWVLLSGAEQATFTDTFDAAFTTPSSPYPTAMRAPRADAFAERWIPGRECLAPARHDRVLGTTGDGAVNVNSTTTSPVPVTDEFTPRLA
jgi:hypothetical protein